MNRYTQQGKTHVSYTCAETAQLVRKALKAAFPSTRLSVRSSTYAGGASIDITWTDGPTSEQVKHITRCFEGADFDGMIDLKSYRYAEQDDGTVVHYGADFIFENRKLSAEFLQPIAERVSKRWWAPTPEIVISGGSAYVDRHTDNHDANQLADEIMTEAWAVAS